MAKVEQGANGGNKPPETLEQRLQRIEADAARKRKEAAQVKAAELQKETEKPAPKKAEKPAVEKVEKAAVEKAEKPVAKKTAEPAEKADKPEAKEKKTSSRRAPAAKKAPAKKTTAKKETTEKSEVETKTVQQEEKTPVKKAPARKTPAKKTATAKKPAAKKKAAAPKAEKVEEVSLEVSANEDVAAAKPAKKAPARKPRQPRAAKPTSKAKAETTEVKETEVKSEEVKPKAKTRKAPARKTAEKSAETKKAAPTKRAPAAKKEPVKAEKSTENKPAEAKKPARKSNTNSRTKKQETGKSQEKKATTTRKTSTRGAKTAAPKPAAKGKSTKKTPARKSNRKPVVAVPALPESDKELIINSTPTQVEIALMENNKLVELHHQKTNNNFTVGDIFLGRIKRLMPGLNAAFVDIGHKKDAFLHYTDLGPKLRSLLKYTNMTVKGKAPSHSLDKFTLEPEIIKTGKIDQVLNKRDNILVQVLKEPIGTKGPRLSCEVTIPGRFLVLTPFVDVIAVSKKIGNSEERKRLKMLIESIKPKNFGVIVRTAAEGKKVQDLHEELKLMMDKWESIFNQLQNSQPPMKLLSELDKTSSILRDILNDSFNSIVVNDKEMYSNIKSYMSTFAPDKVGIVNMHKSRKPIFDERGVTKQIKSSFGKTATMNSGAYLVIEHTEAMHVIDVNSGHKMSSSDQESAVMSVNMESAEEIARQMRLRDIGGIIIVDFIDMRNKDNKQKLVTAMRQFMKKDRAQHTILPLSKFGLMQITRQRVRPEVKINTAELCPSCKGSGKINPSILLTDELERDLKHILQSRPKSKLQLTCHPYIEAYLKKGIPSIQMRWYMKFYKWIKIRANADYSMTAYKFFDGNEDEIRLK